MFAFLFLISVGVSASHQSSSKTEQSLYEHVTGEGTQYSPHVNMTDQAVDIFVCIKSFLGVDEERGTFLLNWDLAYLYEVSDVAWDPAEYDGLSWLSLPASTLWVPDVAIDELVQQESVLQRNQYVHSDGSLVVFNALEENEFHCEFDFDKYPVDKHVCNITFRIHTSSEDKTKLRLVNRTDYLPWCETGTAQTYLEGLHWNAEITAEQDKLVLELERHSWETFLELIEWSSMGLGVIAAFAYQLPVESGEKVSLSITIYLAEILNSLVVWDYTPIKYIPLIDFLTNLQILQAGVVISQITVVWIYNQKRIMPPCIRCFLRSRLFSFCCLCNLKFKRKKPKEPKRQKSKNLQPADAESEGEGEGSQRTVTIVQSQCCKEDRAERDARRNKEAWQQLALFVDQIMFIVYSLMFTTIMLFFFAPKLVPQLPQGDDEGEYDFI